MAITVVNLYYCCFCHRCGGYRGCRNALVTWIFLGGHVYYVVPLNWQTVVSWDSDFLGYCGVLWVDRGLEYMIFFQVMIRIWSWNRDVGCCMDETVYS
jgi:hypothetical protein